jgi:hypothetical protein
MFFTVALNLKKTVGALYMDDTYRFVKFGKKWIGNFWRRRERLWLGRHSRQTSRR